MNPMQAARAVETLKQAASGVRGVILLDPQGTLLARAEADLPDNDIALAREYANPVRQACVLAAEMGWGSLWRLSLRGEAGQAVFAFLTGGLVLGVEADPSGLPGQLREQATRAIAALRGSDSVPVTGGSGGML